MEVAHIRGGRGPLRGCVDISGSKNASLPIFAAALLTEETCILHNVPDLQDIRFMAEILSHLGAKVEHLAPNTWSITAAEIQGDAPYELVRKMRASVCLMGPLLGRLKKAKVSLPGGCVIGQRPIDLHLQGFRKLGVQVDLEEGNVLLDGSALQGNEVFMGGRWGSTVTGTANIIMAAVLTPGTTKVLYSACEPEVNDLCHFLQLMGAKIEGIGSSELTIQGVSRLRGCTYHLMPDRIEAGTFVLLALLTRSTIEIKKANPSHLGALWHLLEGSRASFEIRPDGVLVRGDCSETQTMEVTTLPYPGFPTDLQAQLCALLAFVPGMSIITERVYPQRLMHVAELQRMSAEIKLEGSSVIILGQKQLQGASVMASDLRASAALYLAGLAAKGETWVQRIYHLDRGYERFEEKLQKLGAQIERLPESELPRHLL